MFMIAVGANAQFSNFTMSKTTTASGADTVTATINQPFSNVLGLTFTATKVSGTLAGKVYVYGSQRGNTYTLLDSATVTNTSGAVDYDFNGTTSSKFVLPYWYKYKFYYLQTNGVATVSATALVRSNGR